MAGTNYTLLRKESQSPAGEISNMYIVDTIYYSIDKIIIICMMFNCVICVLCFVGKYLKQNTKFTLQQYGSC